MQNSVGNYAEIAKGKVKERRIKNDSQFFGLNEWKDDGVY